MTLHFKLSQVIETLKCRILDRRLDTEGLLPLLFIKLCDL